ncbi:tryptophan dimethylallyltransferase family protein [Streptomyces aureoversilis]|uniref:Tryptophan dimethylallyltransferase family protein n=1 Tax=Streptomyces aureoversilis TaxID=67277 RepID=A0ABV9ZU98_9ACTN
MVNDLIPVRRAGAATLERMARTLGLGAGGADLVAAFHTMTQCWGTAAADELPLSDVSPDGSPIEFAAELDGAQPALQFAVEPMTPGVPAKDPAAARKVMSTLVERYGVDAERWAAVAEVLLPDDAACTHVAMYGAEARRDGPIRFKVWFYLDVEGPLRNFDLLDAALERLGLSARRPVFGARPDERGRGVPFLLSLDLADDAGARVKVYTRHFAGSADEMVAALAGYPGFRADEVRSLCRLAGERPGFSPQPAVTCVSLADAGGVDRTRATLYVPLWTYAPDDALIRDRLRRFLAAQPGAAQRYERLLADVAHRPLDAGTGLHNYVSWRPGGSGLRRKIYLSPQMHDVNPPAFGAGRRDRTEDPAAWTAAGSGRA